MATNRRAWIAGLTTSALCGALFLIPGRNSLAASASQSPHSDVLVELFTSEGCSSCPPADALLESLDRSGDAIVLSEHVDYWNSIGWTDPYSSPRFSDRQRVYANRLHVDSVYTPQMVVDGRVEFVGSDARALRAAIARSAQANKAVIRIVPGATDGGNVLHVRVEVDPLPPPLQAVKADVYLVVAANDATSQVQRGENRGRTLHHVAVVRSLKPIGTITHGAAFLHEVSIPLDQERDANHLRLVAFVQEPGQGRVIGAAVLAATL